jgi:Domain of unknown function (DUF4082)/F5/8 type C domain/Secretion system C-terminal sorting domain/Fibronectin type III domain
MKKYTTVILLSLFVLSNGPAIAQSIWTQHNDQGRTGWYPYETNLTTNNINTNTFGLAFTQTVDDKILAQPLVIMKVNIPGFGLKNVVYAATLNNSVYAFDADVSGNAYWQKNFTNKISATGTDCTNCRPALSSDIHPSLCGGTYGDFKGNMGICTTPVIDTSAGTMFFVTKIVNFNDGILDNHSYRAGIKDEYNYTTTCFHQYLHAIDITTGNERPNSPVEITGTLNGAGDGQTSAGRITFDPRRQFTRAGLVLSNGKVYISFAAHCDNNPSHGWVLSYNSSTLAQVNAYISTPNDGRGGIWMSGTAPAVDENGNLYVATGNSLDEDRTTNEYNTFNALPSNSVNRGEGVIKLAPDLTISSFFTPFNYISLDDADLDFPTQVLLIPNTNFAITAAKDANMYVMDKTGLGGYNSTKNSILQTVYNGGGGSFHSSFAYFGGQTTQYFYVYPENISLKAYPIIAGGLGTPIVNNTMPSPSGSQGGYMSVSSNGSDPATGVLWAYQAINGCDANQSNCRGILHALSANNITNELWNSEMIATDKLAVYNKFLCPTIGLGKVYIGANTNQLVVYGLKTNTSCLTNVAPGKTAVALTTATGFPASNAIDGTTSTEWTSTAHDVDSIYVDLGAIYNICKIAINWDAAGYGKDFDIKISPDGVNWTTVSSVRGNSAVYNESNGAVSARFVNMRGITRGTSNGYSITEFQVFGSLSNSTCPAPSGLSASATSVTTIFTNQIPVASTDNDGQGFNAGLKFQSSIAGNISGLRFYKTPGNTGTHMGALYNSTGTQLGTLTFGGETSTGWQSANFSSPIAITANKTYTAVYFNATGNYTEDNDYFANSGVTNGPLTALKDGADGCNGPFDYGTSIARPATCFKSANYWIDVMLSNGSASNSELLSWDPISGASQYLIKYRPNNSVSWIYRTTNTNSITITALTCGSQYFFTVQAVCSSGQGAVSQSSFTANPCSGGPTCDPLPTRFFSVDMGDIGTAGSTCRNGAVYTIKGSGTDIGGTGDQFQFVYTNGNDIGDYDVSGRITAQTAANTSSKVGIMVRDSLTNTSRFAYIAYESGKLVFVYRDQPSAAATTINATGTFTLPYFVKISKSGTTYSAFISPDGNGWTNVGSKNLNFGTDLTNTPHYGMAVTSADNTKLSTGIMDGFSLVTAGSAPVIANAGTNQTITLPVSSVSLDGSGSSGTITSYAWTQLSGPNSSVITTPTAVTTTVTGLVAGSYVFQLSLNAGVSLSQVTITVNPLAGSTVSIFTSQIPVNVTDNDHQGTVGHEVGLRFRSSTAGFITGIRFYKTVGNAGTHIGELYSKTGTRLAQATFTNETTTGWQTVMFSTAVAITANTTYVASYFSSLGNYVEDNGYFATTGVTNGNLTALKDGVDGCNGPYQYTAAPAFPNTCYLSANYWVDVIYSGSTSSVVANAGPNQTITLPTSSVTLDGSGSSGATSYTWTELSGPNTAVITTAAAVTTTVTGLIQGVYTFQLSINAGASLSQVTITVNPAAGPSTSIFTTQVPVAVTDNDHQSTTGQELGLRFRSSTAGFITGVRFYKTAGNAGTHTGELYSNTGTRLAQATFSGETSTGWQTVMFSAPVAITANTTYVAAYFSSLGYYVEDNGYFAAAGLTNGNLTALKDGLDGCNGPYKYSAAPAFPNSCYASANYWVDPLFSTSGTVTAQPSNLNTAKAVDNVNDSTSNLSYFLGQNYPNPATENTRIDYGIPKDAKVELALFDLTGRQVKVLVSEMKTAGKYSYELHVADLAKGVYIYKMISGNYMEVKRMIVQ